MVEAAAVVIICRDQSAAKNINIMSGLIVIKSSSSSKVALPSGLSNFDDDRLRI